MEEKKNNAEIIRLRNLKLLFADPEQEVIKWYQDFYEAQKKKDRKKIKELYQPIDNLYVDEHYISYLIERLTLGNAVFFNRFRLLKKLAHYHLVKKLSVNKRDIQIIVPMGKISFTKLSDTLPEFENMAILESEQRQGRCHLLSHKISKCLKFPNEIVTGYVYMHSNKTKFLHSWIEFPNDEEEFVIDPTMNIVINKRGYYFLLDALPISRVSQQEIIEEYDLVSSLGISLKEYLLYRDEIIRDLNRNPQLFRR